MSKYCTKCGAENLDTANFCRACGAKLLVQPSEKHAPAATLDERVQKGYDRIAGWLILLGLSIFIMPFRLLASLSEYYSSMDQEALKILTDASSEMYIVVLLGFEQFINWATLLISFSFWYFFFQRKRAFKKLFIAFIIFTIIAPILDIAIVSSMFPDVSSSASDFGEIFRSIIYAAIWIPYLLISERSKQTFMN